MIGIEFWSELGSSFLLIFPREYRCCELAIEDVDLYWFFPGDWESLIELGVELELFEFEMELGECVELWFELEEGALEGVEVEMRVSFVLVGVVKFDVVGVGRGVELVELVESIGFIGVISISFIGDEIVFTVVGVEEAWIFGEFWELCGRGVLEPWAGDFWIIPKYYFLGSFKVKQFFFFSFF